MDAIEPTTFDEFYLRRYATAVVPLTLASVVASAPALVVFWHARSLPAWQVGLAAVMVMTLFGLAWLSRVLARRVAVLAVTATMGAFAALTIVLAAWEAHVRGLGVVSVLPTAMVVSFIAASFCVRFWQVALSWGVVMAPILAFAWQEPAAATTPQEAAQLARFFATMAVTSTIFYAAVIQVKRGYFRMIRELRDRSRTDSLTGLLNRAAWMDAVDRHRAEAGPTARPAILYLDVDRFKQVNDRFGHAQGDRVLLAIAGALRGVFGETAPIARFGGDEFVVFLPDATDEAIANAAAALRARVALVRDLPVVTLSIGSARTMAPTLPIDEALARADAALLKAKASGRDRFVAGAMFASAG